MKKLKAVLLVYICIVLSLSLMSFEISDINDNMQDSNVLLYVFSAASVLLIILFVFFAVQGLLKSKKDILSSSFSSDSKDF